LGATGKLFTKQFGCGQGAGDLFSLEKNNCVPEKSNGMVLLFSGGDVAITAYITAFMTKSPAG